MKLMLLFAALLLATSVAAETKMTTKAVQYADGDQALEGYVAYDSTLPGKRPGVLIIHDWKGPGEYVQRRAEQLAQLGYVAFAADIYGAGIRPQTSQEAQAEAGKYYANRGLMRRRAALGLNELFKHPLVDSTRTAVIGYCFGGSVAIELARAGANLDGVVSFHGGLQAGTPAQPGEIQANILVLHGADDTFVTMDEVSGFVQEMKAAQANYQINIYSGAVHAFTLPSAGNDPSKGTAYNHQADYRSWAAMQTFFSEIFK